MSFLMAGILVGSIGVLVITQATASTSVCDASGNCDVQEGYLNPGPEGIKVDEPQPTQAESAPLSPTPPEASPTNAPSSSHPAQAPEHIEPCK